MAAARQIPTPFIKPPSGRRGKPARTFFLSLLTIFATGLAAGLGAPSAKAATPRGGDLVVYAAASMRNALDEANAAYAKAGGVRVKTSFAASSALAKQIAAGAPADLFISADLDWMNYLEKRHLIRPETRSNLAGNQIVLIAPAASRLAVNIAPGFPLARLLGGGRLAMADPNAVPAGKYGKAALVSLGVWKTVSNAIAPAENVRAALLLVSRSETPLGIVYKTDATADKGVKILGAFPEGSHPPIIYPIAAVAGRNNPETLRYIGFLKSPAAAAAFEKQGFTHLGGAPGS